MKEQQVFLVGVKKAGTTWLHYALAAHPQIHMSAIKEPNFFCDIDRAESGKTVITDEVLWKHLHRYGTGHSGWIRDEMNYQRLLSPPGKELVAGEASVSYFSCRTAPYRLLRWCPTAKIIVIVRDPIARAWSHAQMDQASGRSSEPVPFVLRNELRELKASKLSATRYLRESFYAEALRRYIELFSKERVLVLSFAEIKANPKRLLERVGSFLNLRADLFLDGTAGKKNVGRLPRSAALNAYMEKIGMKHLIRRASPATLLAIGKSIFYDEATASTGPESEFRAAALPSFQADIDDTCELVGQDVRAWYLSEDVV